MKYDLYIITHLGQNPTTVCSIFKLLFPPLSGGIHIQKKVSTIIAKSNTLITIKTLLLTCFNPECSCVN